MTNKKPINYHELNVELDEVLDKLQSGELDIDDAVKAYERGMELIDQLQKNLKESENTVMKIKANFDKS